MRLRRFVSAVIVAVILVAGGAAGLVASSASAAPPPSIQSVQQSRAFQHSDFLQQLQQWLQQFRQQLPNPGPNQGPGQHRPPRPGSGGGSNNGGGGNAGGGTSGGSGGGTTAPTITSQETGARGNTPLNQPVPTPGFALTSDQAFTATVTASDGISTITRVVTFVANQPYLTASAFPETVSYSLEQLCSGHVTATVVFNGTTLFSADRMLTPLEGSCP